MSLTRNIRKSCAWLSATALANSRAACGDGGSSAPDLLQSYRDQTLQWAA